MQKKPIYVYCNTLTVKTDDCSRGLCQNHVRWNIEKLINPPVSYKNQFHGPNLIFSETKINIYVSTSRENACF